MPRLALVLLLMLSACASSSAGQGPTAVATVFPLAWIVGEVAPDVELTSLAARGQDPHDLELTPQQRAALQTATLVAYLGDIGFQPQVEDAIPSAQGTVVSVAEVVGQDALHARSGEHDEAEAHGEEGADHADEAADPHVWFDAGLMAQVATAVGDAAAAADPERAEQHRRNADTVAAQLRALDEDIADLLSSCRHDTVVVSHEAYAYLLEPAGLEQRGISSAAGHSEASPADISELAALVRSEQLPAVLTEPVEGRTDAEAVAREAGVDLIQIYSLDVVDEAQAERGYPELLREQAQAVARAADCTS